MGALFHVFDLIFHLSGIYFLDYGIWIWHIVVAEFVWFFIKLGIRFRTSKCEIPHFTELAPQVREELLRNYPGLPRYIYHPDVERAEWLNDVVKRLWTPINRTIQKLCRDQLTDLFNKEIQRKVSLNFQFLTVDIGTVPFEVAGVKSYSDNSIRNELCYDVDIVYNGNAIFAFKLGPIRAGLKNFKLRGSLRVVARPILNEPPFIGKLVSVLGRAMKSRNSAVLRFPRSDAKRIRKSYQSNRRLSREMFEALVQWEVVSSHS